MGATKTRSTVGTLEQLTGSEFEEFGHELARAVLDRVTPGSSAGYSRQSKEYWSDLKADGLHPNASFIGSARTGLLLFSYKSTRIRDEEKARKQLKARIIRDIEGQAARTPCEVVVFYNRDLTVPDEEDIRRKAGTRFTPCLYGLRQLKDLAEPHKHILWKWFDESPFVRAVSCRQQEEILSALWIGDFPFSLAAAPKHPALDSVLSSNDNQRIVGQPGSGKSTLVAQFARAHPEHTLVVVSRGHFGNIWEPLKRMVMQASKPVILVFRNFHEMCQQSQEDALIDLVHTTRRVRGQPPIILVEYRLGERDDVIRSVPPEKWKEMDFADEVVLDPAPRDFIEEVFDFACEHFNVTVRPAMREKCIEFVIAADNTPLVAVDWLRDYKNTVIGDSEGDAFYPAPLALLEDRWRSRFEKLKTDRLRNNDAPVLQTLSILRMAEIPFQNAPDLISRCSVAVLMNTASVQAACRSLQRDAWLTFHAASGELQAHDIHISPFAVGLLDERGKASQDFVHWAKSLLITASFPERPRLALCLGKEMMKFGEWQLAQELLAIAASGHQDDKMLPSLIAACTTFSGDERAVMAAIDELRAIAETEATDPRPAMTLAEALERQNGGEKGIQAVRQYLLKDGLVSGRMLVGAINELFSLHDIRGVAEVAREILSNPILSLSVRATAASALAQVGFAKEAEPYLLKFSEDGVNTLEVMKGLAVCFERTRSRGEALGQLRETLRRYPWAVDARLLFAEYVVGINVPEKERSADLAAEALELLQFVEKLHRHNPAAQGDVFAVKGLLLLDLGRRDEGISALCKSAECGGARRGRVHGRMIIALGETREERYRDLIGRLCDRGLMGVDELLVVSNWLREDGKWNASCAKQEGAAYRELGLLSNAEEVLRAGLALDPPNDDCVGLLADVLMERSCWGEAARLLGDFRRATGKEVFAGNEAVCFCNSGSFGDAVEPARIDASKPNAPAQAFRILGTACYKAGYYEAASDAWDRVPLAELDDGDKALVLSSNDLCGRTEVALAHAGTMLSSGSTEAMSVRNAAYIVLKHGSAKYAQQVVRVLNKVRKEDSWFEWVISDIGKCLAEGGNEEAVCALYREAVTARPELQQIRILAAKQFCKLKRWQEAIDVLNTHSGYRVNTIGCARILAEASVALGISDTFLRAPDSVLGNNPVAGCVAAGAAILLGRYEDSVGILASLSSEGYWLERGGHGALPVEGHEAQLSDAASRWLQANSSHPGRFLVKAVKVCSEGADLGEIESILREAADALPNNYGALYELSELFCHEGRVREMLDVAEQMVVVAARDSDLALALKAKAFALIGLGRCSEALEICEASLLTFSTKLFQSFFLTLRALARKDVALHKPETESKALLEQALTDVECAERYAGRSVESFTAAISCLTALRRTAEACALIDGVPDVFRNSQFAVMECVFALASAGRYAEIVELPLHQVLLLRRDPFLVSYWVAIAHGWAQKTRDISNDSRSFKGVLDAIDSLDIARCPDVTRDALRLCWLSEFMLVVQELELWREALTVLCGRQDACSQLPSFLLARVELHLRLGEMSEVRSVLSRFYRAANVACDVDGRPTISSICEKVRAGDGLVRGSVCFLQLLSMTDGDWVGCARLCRLLYDSSSPTDETTNRDLSVTCSNLIRNIPAGTLLNADFASAVLVVCDGFGHLDEAEASAITNGLAHFDLQHALEDCERDGMVAAALASMVLRKRMLSHPAIVEVAKGAEMLRKALSTHRIDIERDRLARKVLEACAADESGK